MHIRTNQKILTSVGIDIGSSTSHLVFSRLTLERDMSSRTEKFEMAKKEIIFSGPIHLTPFSSPDTIDLAHLRDLLLTDYSAAGVSVDAVDTGAVIVTGESAKKQNAAQIVKMLAGESGKFVAATAGPNFEAVLAAHGSGAVSKSARTGRTIMNVDIGGGSSNIAICKNGRVQATCAVNVGGRLLAYDENGVITRLEQSCRNLARDLGLDFRVGNTLSDYDAQILVNALADALMAVIQKNNDNEVMQKLLMTDPCDYSQPIDEIVFSGGVAEYIYHRETKHFGDLGPQLAVAIVHRMKNIPIPMMEPEHRIRATVIGAGQSSLAVSGSTTFLSSGLKYPIRDLPVVTPHLDEEGGLSSEKVQLAITRALARFDLNEGHDRFILAFNGSIRPSYSQLVEFAKGVVVALPVTIQKKLPILLCFRDDIGNSVGNVMRRETGIESPILSIDELALDEGDFVDIGEPIIENVVVPVIVKTLVFTHN